MSKTMINKSILFTEADWIGIKACKEMNPVCENHSDVLKFGFQDARENGIDFKKVPKYKFKNVGIEADPSEYDTPKSFSVESEDWDYVLEKFKSQLNVEKVRISYLARLIIINYRMHLSKETNPEKESQVKVKTKTIDGVELLQRVNNHAAELIKAGELDAIMTFIIGDKED